MGDVANMSRANYITTVGSLSDGADFEKRVRSAGKNFLPKCIQSVIDGAEPTTQYWDYMLAQWELMMKFESEGNP